MVSDLKPWSCFFGGTCELMNPLSNAWITSIVTLSGIKLHHFYLAPISFQNHHQSKISASSYAWYLLVIIKLSHQSVSHSCLVFLTKQLSHYMGACSWCGLHFLYLTPTVLISFWSAIFIFDNKYGNLWSSFFTRCEIWVPHKFVPQ